MRKEFKYFIDNNNKKNQLNTKEDKGPKIALSI